MKTLLLAVILLGCAWTGHAQTAGPVYRYIKVTLKCPLTSNQCQAEVEYGQRKRNAGKLLADRSTGQVIQFEDVMGAVNFLATDGWELVQAGIGLNQQAVILKKRETSGFRYPYLSGPAAESLEKEYQ